MSSICSMHSNHLPRRDYASSLSPQNSGNLKHTIYILTLRCTLMRFETLPWWPEGLVCRFLAAQRWRTIYWTRRMTVGYRDFTEVGAFVNDPLSSSVSVSVSCNSARSVYESYHIFADMIAGFGLVLFLPRQVLYSDRVSSLLRA
jgi:hypothetical protein